MLKKDGLLQALSVGAYITLVTVFMRNAEKMFGKMDTFFSPILFLTLFATSALVCGLLVLAKPYRLFIKKEGEKALNLVIDTAMWLAILFVVVMVLAFIFRKS